jgi:hypothetical protein
MMAENYAEQFKRIDRVCGYAPGNYFGKCSICEREFTGDKRAIHCLPCAIAQLVAERDALREALKPFAALANKFSDTGHGDDWHIGGRHKTEVQHADIRLGDLRRARAALNEGAAGT